uniref:GPN-loop GTPase 3-like n=1 Tax=Podarcis muralis TaxID=64176 RepID=UPI00109FF6D4|nr:GPN-loop GTPase 3-like [Podarcis muralis]
MPRYAQLVMGPAGSGKSTYCSTIVQHCEELNRSVQVVNLDPAAEHFDYDVMADIRELIEVDDVMEDDSLRFGPNGGLVFCMEYLQVTLTGWKDVLATWKTIIYSLIAQVLLPGGIGP